LTTKHSKKDGINKILDIEAKIRKLRKKLWAYEKELQELQNIESKTCMHPVTERQGFEWLHDDGYGTLKNLLGVQCRICGYKNYWPNRNTH
jgi:hypothetical protein